MQRNITGWDHRLAATQTLVRSTAQVPPHKRPIPAISPGMAEPFREAYRHSRLVRRLRKLIPMTVIGGLVLVCAAYLVIPFGQIALPFGVGTLTVKGNLLTMTTPRMSGYTRDNRVYRVEADIATQDLTRSNIVNMQGVRAQIQMAGENWGNVVAAEGVADSNTGMVDLQRDIVFKTTNGYEVVTQKAVIDTKSGSVVTEQPVDIKAPGGDVSANRLVWDNERQVMVLQGRVIGTMMPSEPDTELKDRKDRESAADANTELYAVTQKKD